MITLTRPGDPVLVRLAGRLDERPLSYRYGLLDRLDESPGSNTLTRGWIVDRHEAVIGSGPDDFAAAETALRAWTMFEQDWTVPVHPNVPMRIGHVVTYGARVLGLWWSYGCRILDVIDEPHRVGFVYGTVDGHAARGEERFLVEMLDDGDVVYSLYAASRPGRWFAWPGLPIARFAQRRFRTGSTASMQRFVARRRPITAA